MAEEIIAEVVIALLKMTIAAAADRIGLLAGFKDELIKMEGLVMDIQARVAGAETKKSQNSIVLRWLKDFRGATLEAEIVLDELHYEGLRQKVHESKRGKVCSFFSLFKYDTSFRMRMSSKVKDINEKLKDINQKAQDLELEMLNCDLLHELLLSRDTYVTVEAANRQTDSLPETFVAGRSREESEIVDMLLLGSSDDNDIHVSVLPIVGMGGLGKTTIAKSIYNNGKIVNHFTKRCWICVSDKFEVMVLLKGILESLKGENVEMSSRDDIVREMQKELSGKRFLLVLDDVWNKDSILWDSFFTSLVGLNSANGSCCVLTTRLQITANLACTSSFKPFILGKLLDDDCWFIIGRKATKGEKLPAEFEIHKKEILKKCQGLPLAANTIGGLLSSQCREDWGSIAEKILKIQEDVEGEIMPVLKLSYDYLPSQCIKKCFVYCSIYPKDAGLDGDKLIEYWMAQGYLQEGIQGGRTMEEVGADYLTILLNSSLLEKRTWVSGYYFQMHDLIHDLACSISSEEQCDGDKYRNLTVGGKWIKNDWNENSTLIRVVEGDVSGEMLSKYRHVRVMHFYNGEIKKLPNAIGKLKHVRCLTLSVGGIKSLPESLCTLYHLQTLRLSGCMELNCLPQGLSNMISLRHLHFYRGGDFKMPPNMGRLTCLQTLEFFNVGEENGCRIEELGFMENLKGTLEIRNFELVKSKEEATSAKLFNKKLMWLMLIWGSTTTRRNSDDWEDVLESLEPFPGLKMLTIYGFMGVRLPRWLGKLSSLLLLELKDCKNIKELGYSSDSGFDSLERLPSLLGKLTSLVSLTLHNCPELEHVTTDAIMSLPNIIRSDIWNCPHLRDTVADAFRARPDLA